MHPNEAFLKKLTDLEAMQLVLTAELMGKPYLAALKEQLIRLDLPKQ